MSNTHQQFKAGQARGEGVAKADHWVGPASESDSLQALRSDAAESAQETKEQAAGFLQQAGAQVKHMAESAVETVKSTLGVGDHNSSSRS